MLTIPVSGLRSHHNYRVDEARDTADHGDGGEDMRVVSVINYKGGVGKTTLTANLGAELARRGKRVLLIDLDPQTSLTFSFYAPDEVQRRYPADRTIVQWFNSFVDGRAQRSLAEFVTVPKPVNDTVAQTGGFVGLVPSSLHLINMDMTMLLDAGESRHADSQVYRLRRALSLALRDQALASYDFVLIDCPPNFNVVTQSAIVASDYYLVPASPDYLTTLGTGALFVNVGRLVTRYNQQVAEYSPSVERDIIAPRPLGVVCTMVVYKSTHPIAQHDYFMEQIARAVDTADVRQSVGEVPIFAARVRENAVFGKENPNGVPAILRLRISDKVYIELMELAAEFLKRLDAKEKRAAA